jgi:magnesium transporter
VISTRVYRNGVCTDSDVDPAQISDVLQEDGTVVWMDVTAPSAEDFATIAEEFGLNDLAVEDARSGGQRPKLDHYDDHVFIALYDVELERESGRLDAAEISVFAAPRYLVTVRRNDRFPMNDVVQRWDDTGHLGKHGVGFLLWGLLDVVVDRPRPTEVQRRSFELRKSLVLLRRVVLPTREVLNALMRRELDIVNAELVPYYQDVYDHVLRATDWTDSLRDLVATILETNLTIQSNRMNAIMKAVTSWAAIAAVPTIITGYYGMNVHTWPHANTLLGGLVALGLSIAGVVTLYVTFKRRDWL